MSKQTLPIQLRGAQENNLKGIDLDLSPGQLTVITGLSGTGKSTLLFDVLHAEGQRRYVETFSPYVRQFHGISYHVLKLILWQMPDHQSRLNRRIPLGIQDPLLVR